MISAVMTIGANIQWGYAGLINFGIMGYTALGGLSSCFSFCSILFQEAWRAGGLNILMCITSDNNWNGIFNYQIYFKKI